MYLVNANKTAYLGTYELHQNKNSKQSFLITHLQQADFFFF